MKVLLVLLLLTTLPAWAADYTVSTTARQEAGLDHVLAAQNAERAAQTPPLPPLTKTQYLRSILQGVLDDYARQARSRTLRDTLAAECTRLAIPAEECRL